MAATYLRMLRLFTRELRLFLVTAALVGFAWDGIRAVLLNLYLLRLGYGPEFVGLVNSVGSFAFALLCLPAGTLGTRWGSRRAMIAGMATLTFGFWLLPLVEYLPGAWHSTWLLAVSVLTYLGFALFLVNGLPFMMGATGPVERDHAFSFHIALAPLAAFIGSLVAGALPGLFGSLLGTSLDDPAAYRFPLWLAASFLVPGVLALVRTRSVEEPQVPEDTASASASKLPYGLLAAIGLIMAFRFGGRGAVMTFFNVYLDNGLGVSTTLIGTLSGLGQLLSIPAALVAPLLMARWGKPHTISFGMAGMVLCLVPLAIIPHWAAAGLGMASSSALFSLTVGPIRVFSQELVAPRWRATMASAFMMGAGLAFSAVSLAGGYAIERFGYQTLFLFATGLIAAGTLLFTYYFRVPRGEMAHQLRSAATDQAETRQQLRSGDWE
jgi:MFS family permease